MLFERRKYKKFARQQLSGRWTVPVLMTLISALVLIIFSVPDIIRTIKSDAFAMAATIDFNDLSSVNLFISEVSKIESSELLYYIQIAVKAILEMAGICVFLKMSRSPEPVSLSLFFEGFNNWFRAILAAIWQLIWFFLWSLLFVIPGIIKAFAYSQTMFIVAEYKSVSIPRALKISTIITRGHKGDIFIMLLSFIGWAILASIPAGLGFLWLSPYVKMSFINAYHAMMKEALETGTIKPEDLQAEVK